MSAWVRRAMVAVTPGVLVGIGSVALLVATADRLPEQAHGTGGFGDSLPWSAVIALAVGWCLLITGSGVGAAYLRRHVPTSQRWVGPSGWTAAAVSGSVVLQLVLRNLDLAGPPPRPDLWWTAAPVAVPALLLVGAAGWWAMGPDPVAADASGRPGPHAPRLRLGAGERALWTRSVVSRRGIGWACVYAVAAALSVAAENGYIPVLIFGLLAAVTAAQSWARVRVDEHGVRVVQPLLRRALIGVDLRHVVEADVRDFPTGVIPPGTYGVVHVDRLSGYRAAPGGEALWLTLSEGRRFVVTVPDAATAAALVNTVLDRQRTAAGEGPC